MIAVTFDYGQTLAELDTTLLSARAAERGVVAPVAELDAAVPAGFAAYDAAKRRGESGEAAWGALIGAVLRGAGATPGGAAVDDLVRFLWTQQPHRNLWRRLIHGMEELVADLARAGVPLAIVSNSEGHLVELLEEVGLRRWFPVVADSGVLGIEKPDRGIFEHAAAALGVPVSALVHVGDAWVADIEGALAIGARAVWITRSPPGGELPPGVLRASSAAELRSALRALGVPA